VLDPDQRPEPIPLDLKNPVRMGKRLASATERHGLEMREEQWNQYIECRIERLNICIEGVRFQLGSFHLSTPSDYPVERLAHS
jgi:hypothetical protein